MTIMLVPFMSCSAKIPIYSVFVAAFFPGRGAIVMFVLYLLGILLGILMALILKNTSFRGKPVPFVMELPNYRFPSPKSVMLLLWEKARDFLERAFSVIFIATVVIWFLQSFDYHLNPVKDSTESLLAYVGQTISVIFKPLGFGDWKFSTALISGFIAKEQVVSTLAVLIGCDASMLYTALPGVFGSVLAACSFLVFTLLYTPCVAAVTSIRREFGSRLETAGVVVMQCAVAWIVAFLVYNIGGLFV